MSDTIQKYQEIDESRIVIDPRGFWTRLWDGLEKPWIPLAWAIFSTIIIAMWPAFFIISLPIMMVLWFAVTCKPDTLPIHLPMDAKKIDLNDPKPGEGNGYYMARGAFYIGKIRHKGIEVWANFKALTQHFLIFGTTGAGKTESIVSYIVNYLSVGSGVAFQDAKAAPKAMIQMATFCRIFGRDQDFRVTNYITGMTSAKRDPAERLSNDAAVFARGSAESNTQLLVALIPPSEGDNKLFSERAVALVSSVMPALTDLRDMGKIQIDPGTIRRYMGFKQFVDLYRNNFISKRSRDALQAYLESLPGYDDAKDIAQQPEEVTRQFGFAQAYFTRALASLSDTYGHIYLVALGEIDYQDAVLNGRVLLTLLPSMEKSGDELANLGKIVLTATRNGMVVGLGTVFEGSSDDIVHNLPTNSDIPYGVMNDENAYMLVEGQEMINAQARGLGFGVMTGTQDAPGMLENISRTTKQIMANSAFKQIMYLDDKETTELAIDFSGEANVMVRGQYEMHGEMGNMYAGRGASIERRNRLTATAIKKQGLGQAFIMYQGKVHEMQVFNHGIAEKSKDPLRSYVKHWYSVRMAKIRVPDEQVLNRLIAMSPRQEWIDLELMVKDSSRMMLKEMTTYFSSMLTINRIAGMCAANPDMEALSREAFTARKILNEVHEQPTGLLQAIVEMAPERMEDTCTLLAHLIEHHSSTETEVLKQAEASGIGDLLGMLDAGEMIDAGDGGDTGSGGGGTMPRVDQSSSAAVDPLDSYLNDGSGYENTAPEVIAAESTREEPAQYSQAAQTKPEVPKLAPSLWAAAVEQNLECMPWMSSAVEYGDMAKSMVETELYFTGDLEIAESNIAKTLDTLGTALDYPKTNVPITTLSIDHVRALVSPFIDRK